MGYGCRNGSISEKVQIFGEGSIIMKCSLLYGGLSSGTRFDRLGVEFLSTPDTK